MITPEDVVGVQARAGYPASLLWLSNHVFADDVHPVQALTLWGAPANPTGPVRCPVRLVRESRNKADRNAIKVKVPVLADAKFDPHVGYLARAVAAEWAPTLDRGFVPEAWVKRIGLRHRDDLSTPGLEIYVNWPD